MAEYGDPDKEEEWEFVKTFSPYHNVADNTGGDHPYSDILFTTCALCVFVLCVLCVFVCV